MAFVVINAPAFVQIVLSFGLYYVLTKTIIQHSDVKMSIFNGTLITLTDLFLRSGNIPAGRLFFIPIYIWSILYFIIGIILYYIEKKKNSQALHRQKT